MIAMQAIALNGCDESLIGSIEFQSLVLIEGDRPHFVAKKTVLGRGKPTLLPIKEGNDVKDYSFFITLTFFLWTRLLYILKNSFGITI